MREFHKAALLIFMMFCSCSNFESEVSLGTYRITYKVNTESGKWHGKYIGLNEEVCLCEKPYQEGEWSYTFTSNSIPSILLIEATSEFFDDAETNDIPDITVSIYINGELNETQTNSIADGRSQATLPPSFDINK